MIKLNIVGFLFVAMSPCVFAQSLDGQWEPYSRTAMAITGPIAFEEDVVKINGKSVFRYEAVEQPEYYRLESLGEENPTLLNGNSWCDSDRSPTWLRAEVKGNDLTLMVFDQSLSEPDATDKQTGLCGTYSYLK